MRVAEITPLELEARLASEEPPKLLDVREVEELELSALAFDFHIPMRDIASRYWELDRTEEVVVYCRNGIRSAEVVAYLNGIGFGRAKNLAGGINRWIDEVDPTGRKY
jgi:sulfur-carrier protein adenylyltransferase/sulfurtransferase